MPARGLAFASRAGAIAIDVAHDVPAAGIVAAEPITRRDSRTEPIRQPPKVEELPVLEAEVKPAGCGCRSEPAPAGAAGLLALAWLFAPTRRRSRLKGRRQSQDSSDETICR